MPSEKQSWEIITEAVNMSIESPLKGDGLHDVLGNQSYDGFFLDDVTGIFSYETELGLQGLFFPIRFVILFD